MTFFRKALFLGAAMALSGPALAAEKEGRIQLKLLGTAVLPDGKITSVNRDTIGLAAGSQSAADDNYVPTIAAEYFLTPNFSLETIAGVTTHSVNGRGGLAGASLVRNASIIPATVTAKLHFDLGAIKPYVGAGPTYFMIFGEDPGATAQTLGVTRVRLAERFGGALQAGLDVPINDKGLGLSVDAKRYFVKTRADFFAGNTLALSTNHDLDPWVLSAGLSYRF